MSADICQINNFLQLKMNAEEKAEIPLSLAARWLHSENLLSDSKTSPGFPLRRHISKGNILGAYRKNNYFWYIRRIENYSEILSPKEVARLLELKNVTSVYRKIRSANIPFLKFRSGALFVRKNDFLDWAIRNLSMEHFRRIQRRLTLDPFKYDLEKFRRTLLDAK